MELLREGHRRIGTAGQRVALRRLRGRRRRVVVARRRDERRGRLLTQHA